MEGRRGNTDWPPIRKPSHEALGTSAGHVPRDPGVVGADPAGDEGEHESASDEEADPRGPGLVPRDPGDDEGEPAVDEGEPRIGVVGPPAKATTAISDMESRNPQNDRGASPSTLPAPSPDQELKHPPPDQELLAEDGDGKPEATGDPLRTRKGASWPGRIEPADETGRTRNQLQEIELEKTNQETSGSSKIHRRSDNTMRMRR